jgi:Fe2+ or Zn2+ uptake regulation protein
MNTRFYQGRLKQKGLKVTPQRLAIFSAIYDLNNHPTAEQIFHYIRKTHGNIALGTVYKVLETLADNALIKKSEQTVISTGMNLSRRPITICSIPNPIALKIIMIRNWMRY